MPSELQKQFQSLEAGQKTAEILLADAQETQALGKYLGTILRAGDLVTLSGLLGAGKTTLTQGLGQGLGLQAQVVSPTFVLMNEYDEPQARLPLLHLDAYRLEGLEWEELRDAGLEDFLSRRDAIRLVEWPEMVAHWLPRPRFAIRIEILDEARKVVIEG